MGDSESVGLVGITEGDGENIPPPTHAPKGK